jgi:serine protease
MTKRIILAFLAAGLLAISLLAGGASAGEQPYAPPHHPLYMPNVKNMGNPALQPPPVCCVPGSPFALGLAMPPNMGYFGGHVQVNPKIYLVLWGWGEPGAFDHTTPGMPKNDPDGAGARMLAFIKALGGTAWAGSQTQYYQEINGFKEHINNPVNQFAGVWWDDSNDIAGKHNDADGLTGLELAQEAQRAAAHFAVSDLQNSQFVIAQPQRYTEKGFEDAAGYCAWHDYTQEQYYPGVQEGLAFTNMPYVLNQGTSCGQNGVNAGFYAGRLDGFSIVVGHEIEETITDPGAEDVIDGKNLGGWYDAAGWENADKCAWIGYTFGAQPGSQPIPGAMTNIRGNDGKLYPIQTLWSNDAAGGTGYCAGGSNDLPA